MKQFLFISLLILENFQFSLAKITQVHISYGDTPYEMVVAWSSGPVDTGSDVQYAEIGGVFVKEKGVANLFVDPGPNQRTQYLHRVVLQNLRPNTVYEYRCGGAGDWSKYFDFRTRSDSNFWVPTIAVFGDMGVEGSEYTMKHLTQEADSRSFDLLLAAGDYAYRLDSQNGKLGDEFFNMLQPIIARIPFLAVAGNHEARHDYAHFRNRFENPNKLQTNNFYFSVNVGQVHLVFFNAEFYDPTTYDNKAIKDQYNWLLADLEEANKPANRFRQPWIVVITHRPLYCSAKNPLNCAVFPDVLRKSRPNIAPLGVEDIYFKYGVDVVITGHVHNYERMLPVYNHNLRPGLQRPYHNPRAPIHIVNGAAGCHDKTTNFDTVPIRASDYRSTEYGYTRFRAHNATHLKWEYVSTERDGQMIDSIWFVQNNHGSFENREDYDI